MTNIERKAFVKESSRQAESAQVGVDFGFDVLTKGLEANKVQVHRAVGASVLAAMPVAGIRIDIPRPASGYDMGSGVLNYAGINADQSPKDDGVKVEKAGFDREKVRVATRKVLQEIAENGGVVGVDGKPVGGNVGKEVILRPNMANQVEAVALFVEELSKYPDTKDLWNGTFGGNGLGLNPLIDRDGDLQLALRVTRQGAMKDAVLIPNPKGRYPDGNFDMAVVANPEIGFEKSKGTAPFIMLRQNKINQALYLGTPEGMAISTFIRDTFDKNGKLVKKESLNLSVLAPVWKNEAIVSAESTSGRSVEFDFGWGKAEYIMTEGMPYKGLVANPETKDSMHLYFEEAHYWIYKKTVNPNISKADFLTMLQQGKVEYPVKVTGETFSGGLIEKMYNPSNGITIKFVPTKDKMYYAFEATEAANFSIDREGRLEVSVFDFTRINPSVSNDIGEQDVYLTGRDRTAFKILAFNKDTKNFSSKVEWVRQLGLQTGDMDLALTNTLKGFPGERWSTVFEGEVVTSELPTVFRAIR